jgi:hypothetical protein
MQPRFDTISFLSDYGTGDEFVGVVKSVIRSIAPSVTVIDVSHDIPAFDIRAGSLALARSAQYLCPGVVLAVVDPGVGTDRRAVAIEVGDGQSILVGPDNGLLAAAVGMVGGATAAVELTNPDYQLPAPGPTFAGRDVFAPAAAHLCAGVPLAELGPAVDLLTLLPGVLPLSREEGDTIAGEVLWVDRFGNAQLNIDPAELEPFGARVELRLDGVSRTGVRAATYDAVAPGEVGVVVDSYGMVSIALARQSAAAELGIDVGSQVVIGALDDEGRPAPTSSPITLTPRRTS